MLIVKLESSELISSEQEMKSRLCSVDDEHLKQNTYIKQSSSDMNNNSTFVFKKIKTKMSTNTIDKNSMETPSTNQPDDDCVLEIVNQLSVSSSNDSRPPLADLFTQSSTKSTGSMNNQNNSSKVLSPATSTISLGHIQINLNDSNQSVDCSVCGDKATGKILISQCLF